MWNYVQGQKRRTRLSSLVFSLESLCGFDYPKNLCLAIEFMFKSQRAGYEARQYLIPPIPGTSQNVYSNNFNLDLAEHNCSTQSKANFRIQFRKACIVSPDLLLACELPKS